MSDRNQPCPCGSGKKMKKCCGAAAKAQASQNAVAAAPDPGTERTAEPGSAGGEMPFYKPTGRGLGAEKTDADRSKHLRRRLQSSELRGTLVYNNGAFFRPPPPRKPGG
jgi:hypothetical protein